MCGIAGVMHDDRSRPVERENLVAMAAILHHRGPDGYGCSMREGIGFGHSRLTIVDLDPERGRQPFSSANERFMLSKNGELYGYQRLRASLTAQGARFRSKSDSELILHLYPRLGFREMLPFLRGEFAFALYDRDEDTLFLARDRFGIKPLYWTRTPHGVVFGSELKALFAHPEVERKFEPAGLFHQLMQTMVPGTTAFSGIHQIKPGHYLEIRRRDGQLHITDHRYWDMPFPAGPTRTVDDEQPYIDAVRQYLVDAVHLRLEADVPVGC